SPLFSRLLFLHSFPTRRSSDLHFPLLLVEGVVVFPRLRPAQPRLPDERETGILLVLPRLQVQLGVSRHGAGAVHHEDIAPAAQRSEERRVGNECRSTWSTDQAEDGIRDPLVTGVQTCALPISIFRFFSSRGSWYSPVCALPSRASRTSGKRAYSWCSPACKSSLG